MRRSCPIGILLCFTLSAFGQSKDGVDTLKSQSISEVTVTAHQTGSVKANTIGNMELISSKELLRAACCNLGESFTTNPSVDVNYADAATGAQQIKLLGLSGTYVQMLTENIPQLPWAGGPILAELYPWSLDAEHTSVEGCLVGEEWLREHHGTD